MPWVLLNKVFGNCIFTRIYLKDTLGIENIFSETVFLTEELQQYIVYHVLTKINWINQFKYYNISLKSSKKRGLDKHNWKSTFRYAQLWYTHLAFTTLISRTKQFPHVHFHKVQVLPSMKESKVCFAKFFQSVVLKTVKLVS